MTEENLNYPGAEEALRQFAVEGCLKEIRPYGNGHINDTYLAVFRTENGEEKEIYFTADESQYL